MDQLQNKRLCFCPGPWCLRVGWESRYRTTVERSGRKTSSVQALRASSGAERPVRRSSADDERRYYFASQPRQETRRFPDLGIALPYRPIVRLYGYLSSISWSWCVFLRLLYPSLRKRRAFENQNSGHRPTPSPLQAIPQLSLLYDMPPTDAPTPSEVKRKRTRTGCLVCRKR